MHIDLDKLLVDGQKVGKITGLQISVNAPTDDTVQHDQITIFYLKKGLQRVLTCELGAISFES